MNRIPAGVTTLLMSLAAFGQAPLTGPAGTGSPDPSQKGNPCSPTGTPTTPGQGQPSDGHDNEWCAGANPCEVECGAYGPPGMPGFIDPASLAPGGIFYPPDPPPPDPAPGPILVSAYNDAAPVCSGSREAVELLDGWTEDAWGTVPPYQGFGWFQMSRPELVVSNSDPEADQIASPNRVRIVLGGRKVRNFVLVAGSSPNVFVGVNGHQGVVERIAGDGSNPELYRYSDTLGNAYTFFGYYTGSSGTWVNPYGAKGQIWKAANNDGAGDTWYTGHATNPVTALSSGFVLDGSSNPTPRASTVYDGAGRKWSYEYNVTISTTNMLTAVKIQKWTGSEWLVIWKVEYGYYETFVADKGTAGDLKTITTTSLLSNLSDAAVHTTYFRYYTDTSPYNYKHLIKCKVDPEGVRRAGLSTLEALGTSGGDLTTLKSYAAQYYEYDSAGRVSKLTTGGGCGCGGTDGVYEFQLEVNGSYSSAVYGSVGTGDWSTTRWERKVTTTYPNGSRQCVYYDEMGWMLGRVHTDAANSSAPFDPSTNQIWINKFVRDEVGRVVEEYTPAAVDSSSYNHTTGSITVKTDAGLVNVTAYRDPDSGLNYLIGAVEARKFQQGSGGSPTTTESFTYVDPSGTSPSHTKDFGSTNPARLARPLVATRSVYHQTGTPDVWTMSYTFHTSSWAPKSIATAAPALGSGDTSAPATLSSYVYLDILGRRVMSVDGSGSITFTKYDANGQVAKVIADPSGSDSDANSAAANYGVTLTSPSPINFVTEFTYDDLGRTNTVTHPGGRVQPYYYTKLADGRLVELSVPFFASGTSQGPASYTVKNLAGKVEAQSVIGLSNGTTATAMSGWVNSGATDIISAVLVGTVQRLKASVYDNHGTRLDSSRLYHSIPSSYSGGGSTYYDLTVYGYDESGNLRRVKDPTGTIVYSKHDKRGRLYERYVGTNDSSLPGGESSGTDNMVIVESVAFDSGGIGNGLVTSRTQYVDGTSGHNRTTSYTYDLRGRRLTQTNAEPPHYGFAYDNVGSQTAHAEYSSTPGDPLTHTTGRLALQETILNSRGQTREHKRHKIDSGSSTDSLSSYTWYDGAGRVIKSRGDQLTKAAYDKLGRPTLQFVLATDNDSDHSAATSVSGDIVMEESQALYDVAGDLAMSVLIQRHPNESTTVTGALDAVGDTINVVAVGDVNFKGRAQITSYFRNDLAQEIATVRLGTNGGATTYTRSSDSIGTPSASRLIVQTAYNPDGTPSTVTDELGRVAMTFYDAAGRTTKTIANHVDGTPGGGTNGDNDQVIEYVFTNGLMTSLTAKAASSSDDQTTEYVYGVLDSGQTPASQLNSNRLLRKVVYPDSTGSSDAVVYAYNRLGQQVSTVDQAGNQVDTEYDDLGREVNRTVTTVATGFDGEVRRINIAYLSSGLVGDLTQYNVSSAALDQVRFEYDGWQNLLRFRQDVDSAMDSSGESLAGRDPFYIEYTLAKSAPTGGAHTLRRTTLAYKALSGSTPSTFRTVGYTYGGTNSPPDHLSRVDTVTVGSSPTTVASYKYLGVDSLVGTTLDQPNVATSVFTESGGAHTYADLDEFNRPKRWDWVRGGAAAFYNVAIGYDAASQVTHTVDDVHIRNSSTPKHIFDVVYTMDGLGRLIGADEGHKGTTGIDSGTRTRNELWNSLSLTGNWGNRKLDIDGDGTFTSEQDRDEPLAHNTFTKANEWTARRVQKSGSDRDEHTYTYDAVGNLTGESNHGYRGVQESLGGRTFEYDVFGRLRRVRTSLFTEGDSRIAEYRYNGLGFRIMSQYDLDHDETFENGERTYFMYDERWRMLAAFQDGGEEPSEAFVHHDAGHGGYGDASELNAVILRDRTLETEGTLGERRFYCQNWRTDVVAITRSDGQPVEFVRYSPYGEPTVYPLADVNMNGVVNSADSTAWNMGNLTADFAAAPNADLDFDGDVGTDFDIEAFMDSYDATTGASGVGSVSSCTVANRFGYAGYEWDQSISLYHVRHRVYTASQGLWLNRDPLGYVDGTSLYEYVHGDPVVEVDPLGLCTNCESGGDCRSNGGDDGSWQPPSHTPGDPDSLVSAPGRPHLYTLLASGDSTGNGQMFTVEAAKSIYDCWSNCVSEYYGGVAFTVCAASFGIDWVFGKTDKTERELRRPHGKGGQGKDYVHRLRRWQIKYYRPGRHSFVVRAVKMAYTGTVARFVAAASCGYTAGVSLSCFVVCSEDPSSH